MLSDIEADLNAAEAAGLQTQRAEDGERIQRTENVWKKVLTHDPVTGRGMYLFRGLPGTVLEAHVHEKAEQFFFIEGESWMDGRLYSAGDAQLSVSGTAHAKSTIPNGCLFLVYD